MKKYIVNGALGDVIAFSVALKIKIEKSDKNKYIVFSRYPEVFNGLCASEMTVGISNNSNNKKINFFKKRYSKLTIYKYIRDLLKSFYYRFQGINYIGWIKSHEGRSDHLVNTYLKQIDEKPFEDQIKFERWIPKFEDQKYTNKNYFVIAPEAGWQSREWVNTRWIEVCDEIKKMDYEIIVVGMNKNDDQFSQYTDLRGSTSLNELFLILDNAHMIVCVDSGIFHMASILKKKTISLFGPVNHKLRIYNKDISICIESKSVPCLSCFERVDLSEYRNHCIIGNNLCMKSIPANEVIKNIKEIV